MVTKITRETQLTVIQAFNAMTEFLEDYYGVTKDDEVGGLLGAMNMNIFEDGKTADPAVWGD